MKEALKLIIARSLNLQANITNYEIGHNADDKYMDANLELAEELLIEAINNYITENAVDFLMKNPEKDPPLNDAQIESEQLMGRCNDYPNCIYCGP